MFFYQTAPLAPFSTSSTINAFVLRARLSSSLIFIWHVIRTITTHSIRRWCDSLAVLSVRSESAWVHLRARCLFHVEYVRLLLYNAGRCPGGAVNVVLQNVTTDAATFVPSMCSAMATLMQLTDAACDSDCKIDVGRW